MYRSRLERPVPNNRWRVFEPWVVSHRARGRTVRARGAGSVLLGRPVNFAVRAKIS